MSHVEAFATEIKIESSDQGIKVTSKVLKTNNQEHGGNLTFDP